MALLELGVGPQTYQKLHGFDTKARQKMPTGPNATTLRVGSPVEHFLFFAIFLDFCPCHLSRNWKCFESVQRRSPSRGPVSLSSPSFASFQPSSVQHRRRRSLLPSSSSRHGNCPRRRSPTLPRPKSAYNARSTFSEPTCTSFRLRRIMNYWTSCPRDNKPVAFPRLLAINPHATREKMPP